MFKVRAYLEERREEEVRNVKKILGMAMVGLFAFIPFLNVSAQTEWILEDWETENGDYGRVTVVNDPGFRAENLSQF